MAVNKKKLIVTCHQPSLSYPMTVSQDQLNSLENTLLSRTGNVPLHKRFRALFTLKSLKDEDAVRIISQGTPLPSRARIMCSDRVYSLAFSDDSALLKHELAYCLGQMKVKTALPTLESVLRDENEDPMVRHEVRLSFEYISYQCLVTCREKKFKKSTGSRSNGRNILLFLSPHPQRILDRLQPQRTRNL